MRKKTTNTVSITESRLRELVEEGEIKAGSTKIDVLSNKEFMLVEE